MALHHLPPLMPSRCLSKNQLSSLNSNFILLGKLRLSFCSKITSQCLLPRLVRPGGLRCLNSLKGLRFKTHHGVDIADNKTKCVLLKSSGSETTTIVRRSGNYQPPIWDYNYIQSLKSDYVEASYKDRLNKLKGEVRMMIGETILVDDPLLQLELIDVLQRLGLSYHFEDEIDRMLVNLYNNIGHYLKEKDKDLYAVALAFRLLRQHAYNIPQDIFVNFMNGNGKFKECVSKDTKEILCLYEASYLSVEGEHILEKAREFSTKYLQAYVKNHKINKDKLDVDIISHAFELPLHWRMPRLETRWFIDVYQQRKDMSPLLLDLAKLDYNMVQAIHLEDLKHVSRWWSMVGLAENLRFARDRLMENFLWTVGTAFEPELGYCRRMSTKFNAFITTLDDVYDVYGTLDELNLFTQAVERWDINSIEHLPDYMKIYFLALDEYVNEMTLKPLKSQGINITSYLKKTWADLCKAYLLEAQWYHSGYTPSLQEYIDNAWISISAPLILVHAYFLTTNYVTPEALECLFQNRYHNIIRWSAMILRLADDLGTSSEELKRGDVPKSIQCYMHETGVSEEDARNHIRHLIASTWNKMNKDSVSDSPFSEDFIKTAMNLARMSQCMYQFGDGHAAQDQVTIDRIHSLLIQPIPM